MPVYDFESRRLQRISTRRPPIRRAALLISFFLLLVFLGAVWLGRGREDTEIVPEADVTPSAMAQPAVSAPDSVHPPDPLPQLVEISGRIRRGEAFSEALNREDISHAEVFELVSAVRSGVHRAEFNPNIVQRGDRYMIAVDSLGSIHRFEYVKRGALETRFVAERQNGALKAWKETVPLDRQVVVVSGRLEDVLWNALRATGENPDVLSDRMVDIFEFYIDFMVDCRPGDRFSLAVEKCFKDGEFVRYGDILTAEYRSARKSYQAFLYEGREGDEGYYSAEGKSLRGLFLKSPLNYRRISSRYSQRRFHPVLKKYTPHHGIDYAAGYGTAVWATADGVVTFVGRKGALGNYVEIRHKNGYKTGYGHLSRFRRGLRKGTAVKQKQIIGYVGATGRATGPHLHYNFIALDRGKYRYVDPAAAFNHPTGKPIPQGRMSDFVRYRDRLWALLDRESGSIVTTLLPPGPEVGVSYEASTAGATVE